MCSPFNWVYQFSDVVLINCHEHAALKHWHSIKTTMKYHLTAVRAAIIKKSTNNKCWRGWWHLTPVLLPGKSHGWRSLVSCSPWGRKESDMTERLHFHFSLSCIGEGNGNPLQCSCLENPRDGGAWWAAIYGVTQSRTRLKWHSSRRGCREKGTLLHCWWGSKLVHHYRKQYGGSSEN